MVFMKRLLLACCLLCMAYPAFCWGFYAHRQINYYAVFLLPPEMLVLYKPHIDFITEHAIDPDKRRYVVAEEGPRHYIDMDHYGAYPYDSLPRQWTAAVDKYHEDSIRAHGIVPWWIQIMLARLTNAFASKNQAAILKLSAEIGHYIADAHVPLHATSNYNGQHTGQQGIHGFWESRIPELLAEKEWDFFIGRAGYIADPLSFTWKRVLESAAAADTVLLFERQLSASFATDQKYAFEERNGVLVKQYAAAYARAYHDKLNNMIQRRMRQSVYAVASFWFTAWVNAGQPDLKTCTNKTFSEEEIKEFRLLNEQWKNQQQFDKRCD
jgi:hypothetical protein